MRIVLVGDTHGIWKYLYKMMELENPEMIVHCGDWGCYMDDRIDFEKFIQKMKVPIVSVYGNHDDMDQMMNHRAPNYTWLPDFTVKKIKGIRFMGINGNIAGSPRHPWHYTEEMVRERLSKFLDEGYRHGVDFIVSHECPKGFADIIKSRDRNPDGTHKWKKNAGYQSLAEVLETIQPKFWLCGHLHFQQVAQFKDTILFNAGYGAVGRYVLLDTLKKYKPEEWLSTLRKVEENV